MKYEEMVQEFKDNGVNIEDYSYSYGLLATRPGFGFIFNIERGIFQHEYIGDRDNGNVDKIYETEDEMVYDMICAIRHNAISNKTFYKEKGLDTSLNQKVLDIADMIYDKISK